MGESPRQKAKSRKLEKKKSPDESLKSESVKDSKTEEKTVRKNGRKSKVEEFFEKLKQKNCEDADESDSEAVKNDFSQVTKSSSKKTKTKNSSLERNVAQSKNKSGQSSKSELKRPSKSGKPHKDQKTILNYFNRVLEQRYHFKAEQLKFDDPNVKGISEFETEKDSGSDKDDDDATDEEEYDEKAVKETKRRIMDIISMEDEEVLSVMEKNEELSKLEINIYWDVPLLHKIETRVTSIPTKEQRALFSEIKLPIKKGPFTKVEDEKIKKNFEEFCKEHNLNHDPTPFLKFRYGKLNLISKRERINFVRYLGKGLDNRKLWRIYQRFKILNANYRVGRFTHEEDLVIVNYLKIMKNDVNKYSSLSKILRRPRLSIEKRAKRLAMLSGTQKLLPTTYPKVIKCIMNVTKVNNLKALRNRNITEREWSNVSRNLKIPKDKITVLWYASLYTKIFHKGPIKVDAILKKLLDTLDKNEETDYRNINWSTLALPFENVTRAFLYRLFKKAICKVPVLHHQHLRRCVIYLKKLYKEEGKLFDDIPNIVFKDL